MRHPIDSGSAARRIVLVAAVALIAAPALAATLGPANPPPGGVTVVASGDIGRSGGLTWSFTGLDYNYFTSLYYGPAGATSLGFAFDDVIDDDGEWLTYDPGNVDEDLGAGRLIFTGVARIYNYSAGGYYNYQTRLVLDFDGDFGSVVPGLSVLRPDIPVLVQIVPAGVFSVNLRLEVLYGSWRPVLDFFDSYSTYPGHDAITDVTTAFFYEKDDLPAILDALAAIEAKLDDGDPRIDEILAHVTTIDGRSLSIEGNTVALIDMTQRLEAKLDDANFEGLHQMSEMLVKIAAERALLEHKRVAMIYLPFDNGGVMEHIRDLVTEKIQNVEDSGESANSAEMYMTLAQRELDFGRFKRAFNYFSRAYCEAVKSIGERCPQ